MQYITELYTRAGISYTTLGWYRYHHRTFLVPHASQYTVRDTMTSAPPSRPKLYIPSVFSQALYRDLCWAAPRLLASSPPLSCGCYKNLHTTPNENTRAPEQKRPQRTECPRNIRQCHAVPSGCDARTQLCHHPHNTPTSSPSSMTPPPVTNKPRTITSSTTPTTNTKPTIPPTTLTRPRINTTLKTLTLL